MNAHHHPPAAPRRGPAPQQYPGRPQTGQQHYGANPGAQQRPPHPQQHRVQPQQQHQAQQHQPRPQPTPPRGFQVTDDGPTVATAAVEPEAPQVPKTLLYGALSAAASALTGIITAAVIMTIGPSLLVASMGLDTSGDVTELADAAGYEILWNRAVFWLIFAGIFLALVASLRIGQTWARVLYSLFVPLMGWLLVWDMMDATPTLTKVLNGFNLGFAVVAVVLVWLGPSNAYVKARKQFRRARRSS
ncbi:hypothetical protein NLX83_36695 [Allokutzneria sp. A3M-2-11 16]|uniref:hypothetical protein n=1 Tax=Allokutzneria sp. A3M-2-11 16 TaxID=2962043 RepID=UPI0020B881BD|nr:hypothetical protein [Allokutzneria sp. A3M-2-11 16]MCP3804820.1 hypothetical protein [Allokutzneria sp. A3M-2-11 16]